MSLKIFLFIAAFFMCIPFLYQSGNKPSAPDASFVRQEQTKAAVSNLTFEKDILPIFKTHCNPCHFPGGKMYERLPFDQSSTIVNHADGILRRIKDSSEVQKITRFVEESKKAGSKS